MLSRWPTRARQLTMILIMLSILLLPTFSAVGNISAGTEVLSAHQNYTELIVTGNGTISLPHMLGTGGDESMTDGAEFEPVISESERLFSGMELSEIQLFKLTISSKDRDHNFLDHMSEHYHPSSLERKNKATRKDIHQHLSQILEIRGLANLFHVLLWGHIYKDVIYVDHADFWKLVEKGAKKILPGKSHCLVHVTGSTHVIVSELQEQTPEGKRSVIFKGCDFYLGVKQNGESDLLEYDVAEELVQDLVDIGVKREVCQSER